MNNSLPILPIGQVTQVEGKPWFRYDYDSCDGKESWGIFIDIQEELRTLGWELEDPQIEHDCLTGRLQPFSNQPDSE